MNNCLDISVNNMNSLLRFGYCNFGILTNSDFEYPKCITTLFCPLEDCSLPQHGVKACHNIHKEWDEFPVKTNHIQELPQLINFLMWFQCLYSCNHSGSGCTS